MEKITSTRIKASFTIALAACMAFVYPAHVIIDHSGLFDHHNHSHHHKGHDHSDEQTHNDDDLCTLCLSLNSIEASEHVQFLPALVIEPFFDSIVLNGCNKPEDSTHARAPPAGLLI